MAGRIRKQKISLAKQLLSLRQTYGGLIEESNIKNSMLTCVIRLQPASDCAVYRVKITYKISDFAPKAWLIEPKLQSIDDKLPHHLYGHDKDGHPRLCVYYPGYNEWNQNMMISKSFVPWIITWLNTYEYWLITGEWLYDEAPRGNEKK